MVWRRPGDKPLSEPVVVSLLMHLCVTRPQWIKNIFSHHRVFSTMEHLTIQSLGALWVWTIPNLTRAVTHCVLITGGFNGSDKITKHCQKQHFLPEEFWPLGIVVAWVCLSLCMCVNPKLVHTKTDHQYKLKPLNLVKRCKTPWLRSLLFWGAIDQNFIMPGLSTRVHTQPPEYTHNSHQDRIMILTVSQSPSSAHTYLPRLLHSPDCFTVSILGVLWPTASPCFIKKIQYQFRCIMLYWFLLTQLPLVPHICVSELGQHWFR